MLISGWDQIRLSHLHFRCRPTLLSGEFPFCPSLFLFKTILAIPGSLLLRTHLGLTLSHFWEDAGVPVIQSARYSIPTQPTLPLQDSPPPPCFFPPLYSMLPATACLENQPASPSRRFMPTKMLFSCRKPSVAAPDILLSGLLPLVPISGMLSMADIL
jgi:hypothetical protein